MTGSVRGDPYLGRTGRANYRKKEVEEYCET
jgi:hypothetical protein